MKDFMVFGDTCSRCGLCAEVCPNKIISSDDLVMNYIEERKHLCFNCGQCMAICPSASVVVKGLSYDSDFFELPKNQDKFLDLISTRRAIRNFKDTPVPKEMLEKIVEAIKFAPPGFPPIKSEIIVVQDTDVIREALKYMIEVYDGLVEAISNPIKRIFVRKQVGHKKYLQMESHLIPMLKSRLPGLKNGTEDTITRNAPALIIFHTDKNGEEVNEDIFVAATYAMLAAHSLGLGGSIMDIIPPAIDRNAELRKLFCIPKDHEVIASVIIGYPKYKYSRGIKRKLKSVRWI